VFPFDRPAAPGEDGNQSLAVNTTDGSVVYDVAFALVWADTGEDATARNEAYAFASCADCAAVAVGFQVVLVVGQTNVIVPENLSAAANYNCLRCLTYALADQLVLTLDGPLSAEGSARLDELWQQIADFGRSLQNVPLSEIQGRLDAFKRQIMDVIRSDPNARPGTRSGSATSPPATPSTAATQPPSPGATQSPSPGATGGTQPAGGSAPTAPARTGGAVPTGETPAPGSAPAAPSAAATTAAPAAPAPTSAPASGAGAGQVLPAPTATASPTP
jgi:putative peptide zinc metalloprotease protein